MATEEVVKSIFGPTPLEIEQAQRKRVQGLYSSYGQMGGEPGIGGIIGVGLGQLANSLFNLEDPQLTKSKDMKMILNETRSELTPEQIMNPTVYFPHLINKLDAKGYEIESSQIQAVASDEIAKWNKQKLEEDKARASLKNNNLTTVDRIKNKIKEIEAKLSLYPNDAILLQDLADYKKQLSNELDKPLSATQQLALARDIDANPSGYSTEEQKWAKNIIAMDMNKYAAEKGMAWNSQKQRYEPIEGGKVWKEDIAKLKRQIDVDLGGLFNQRAVNIAIDEALALVSTKSTGLAGAALKNVPKTDAYRLNQKLETIIATIGFDRLQRMREESPTGGALGQVAVLELKFLQKTEGSFDIGQDADTLRKRLNILKESYGKTVTEVNKDVKRMQTELANKYNIKDYKVDDEYFPTFSQSTDIPKPMSNEKDVDIFEWDEMGEDKPKGPLKSLEEIFKS